MSKNTRFLTHAAVIAALYAVLTHLQNVLLPGSTTWAIQMRLSEALCVLSFFTPAAIPGLTVGCLVFNITYAAALPLRPVMVFIPEQKRQIVAQFRQNSLLRLKPGDDAEVVFNALPGQVFHGKLTSILPVVPGGSYQAQGVLQSLTVVPGTDGVLGTIELDPNDDIDALPDGIYAQVAVYSDHFSHVSVMRKVLLRMTSWMHYLYLDH